MTSRPFLLVVSALFSTSLLPLLADDAKPAEVYAARTFTDPGGATLPYRLLQPEKIVPGTKYPLVLFLHGAGERGTDNLAQIRNGAPLFAKAEARAKYPCFVVAPQCPPEQTWSAVKGWTGPNAYEETPTPAMKLVLGALEGLEKELPVDPDRLYVTGLSMGGYGTWDLLTRQPGRWAAAAPVCGGGDASRIVGAKVVPIWAFHGMLDPTVPVVRTREMITALQAAGGHPMASEYPYLAHDSWTTAYGEPELLPWLFAQRRGQPEVPFFTTAQPFAQPPSSLCPGEGPMQSGLWFRALWKGRREQWAKDAPADQGAVVFFGDSITQGWNTLAKDFSRLKVANRGVSGDTTRGLRTRVAEDVLAVHSKLVSLLIGTNDLDQGAEPEVVATNLRALVAELRKADARLPIVINLVMPRGAKPGKFPEKIKALNGVYQTAFQNDPRIAFCDTWALFDDGTGQCSKDEFPDLLHPNAAGYAKWTAALQPVIDRLLAP